MVDTEDRGEGQVIAGCRHRSTNKGGDEAEGGDANEPHMHRPPIESQLLTEGIWGDQQEERGERNEEPGCTVGVKGVPHGCGDARGGERPPGWQRAEHDACGADAAQAST